ncbi:hypothetical protein ABZ759_05435 [Streptomyces sp. NPDC047860]|uniref:hypothetical protein n=1 Tax=Streptomyces sp. NPDC047860 TaxID=3155743 RepID=UPI0033E1B6AF
MSDTQAWLIPKGADGGEFKWEVQFLQSIARPLEESTSAARKISGERADQRFDNVFQVTEDNTGAGEVTEAVNDFLDKWCHGLGCIADDADVIVTALSATINDFLVREACSEFARGLCIAQCSGRAAQMSWPPSGDRRDGRLCGRSSERGPESSDWSRISSTLLECNPI